jgi:ligand-binding sensor domain-containing protein
MYNLPPSGNRVYPLPLPGGISPKGVHNIIKDRTGKWWFATYSNGVYVLDQDADSMSHYTHQPGNKNSLSDNRIFCQLEDKQGNIWIGTQNKGLCKISPASGIITCYEYRKNDPTGLPDNNIFSLLEGEGHRLWIGTENGLALMDLDKGNFKVFTTLDGLASNVIFTITPGQDGHLWLATNNGICDFDTRTFKFRNYFIPVGLPNNRIDGAALATSGSGLYFSTGSYLIHCDPGQLINHRQPPPVVVTVIQVYNQPFQLY